MDNDIKVTEDPSHTNHDVVDGSVKSRLRRRRGVKVTGKYLPPLEWEKIKASHSVSSLKNSYFENIYNGMEKYFQASDVSTKLLLKDERQGSEQKDTRRDNSYKTEEEKQRMESVVSIQTSGTKHAEDVPEEKMISKLSSKNIHDKTNEDHLHLGSAIPRETLEELKCILKETPLIIHKNKWNPKSTTCTTVIHSPNQAKKPSEKSDLTFETFKPHLHKEKQMLQSAKTPDTTEPHILTGQILPDRSESHEEEELILHKMASDADQKLIPNKANNVSQVKFDHLSTNENVNSDCKQIYATHRESQTSLQLLSCIEFVKQQTAREDIHFVRFEAADLHGVCRSKTVPARFFQERAAHGIYMPRSYLELTLSPKDNEVDHINSIHFKSDIILKPDLQTFRVLPWTAKTARVICDSYTFLGDPLLTSPRYLAKRLLSQLEEIGFSLHSAFTYEFCVFGIAEIVNSKTISFPAATLFTDHDQSFMQDLFDGLYYTGGNIESFSTSIGPGQMEISFQPDYGLQATDNAFTFKTAIKEVAKKHGCIASFYTDMAGFYNSGIFSHSLWDINGKKNLFYSGDNQEQLTDIGKNWLSGLLLHSAALSSLVAPGVACRKFLSKDSKESQDKISATWGLNNNSSTYNVKSYYTRGTYIENQLCSAMANPYLVLAITVAAGLDGIKRGLNLVDSLKGDIDVPELKASTIPLKLEDALSALQEDKCIRAYLGEPFIQYFIAMKQYELETELDSERNKFLEYFI
ncbi:hypothetical protein GDO81_007860 [Engystomops pustulosus]|uniref:Lengsin n=2 Tax=Engystomops pustulosus TaxID=76066 RepID=A0AAV7CA62_ENGPU|nr:hypothetical protein GDO81_007860 [Engystomops pustulosus]